jgi:hypothetical protein
LNSISFIRILLQRDILANDSHILDTSFQRFILNNYIHYNIFLSIRIFISLLITLILFSPTISRSQFYSCDLNWQNVTQISDDSVLSISPQIATEGNGIHIIWFGIDTIGGMSGAGIQYSHSFNGGGIFSSPRTIVPPDIAFSPGQLAHSGFNVFITFTAYIDGVIGTGYIRSSDGGFTWSVPNIIRANSHPRLIAAYDSVVIIHYADQKPATYGVLRSGDYGLSWKNVTTSMPPLNDVWLTETDYYGTGATASTRRTDVGYYFSPNGGVSWFGPEIISQEDAISSLYPKIAIDEMSERYLVWNDTGSIIFRRSNGFDAEENIIWTQQKTLPASKDAIFPDLDYAEGLLAVVWDNHAGDSGNIVLQHSTNKGESFCDPFYPAGNPRAGEPVINLQENILNIAWSGTVDGNGEIFFRRGIFPGETRPKETLLKQNYPNPFSSIATIEYEIEREGMVRLAIFDLLGRKVETLVHDIQKPRRYSVKFNGSNLSSGVYFCRLWSVQFSDTKKMILLR